MRGVRWFGPTGRDQTYVPQGEPTFRKGGGAQGRGKNAGVPGAGVGNFRSEEGVQGGGVGAVGQGGGGGTVASWSCSLAEGSGSWCSEGVGSGSRAPEKGSQVAGLVEVLLPQKPATPVPTTPTHAEMVARLHVLYDSEKKVSKKVEEAKGRLETARLRLWTLRKGWLRWMGNCKEFMNKLRPF